MSIQHAGITDPDIHEVKGASTASTGTVPVANGAGQAPFGFYDYNYLINRPSLGSASGAASTDFATAAQGTKADNSVQKSGDTMSGPLGLMQVTLITLPDAATYNKALIIVTNATAGPAVCFSNGTSWIDIRTNAVVS